MSAIEQFEQAMRRSGAEGIAAYQDGLDAAMASGQALLLAMHTLHGEWLAFLQTHVKNSLTASHGLAACDSVATMIDLQLDHLSVALQGHLDAMDKLVQLVAAPRLLEQPDRIPHRVAASNRAGLELIDLP